MASCSCHLNTNTIPIETNLGPAQSIGGAYMSLHRLHTSIRLVAPWLLVGATLIIAHPAFAAGARANYVEIASWDTGYQAQYTISNDGPGTISQWTVAFDLPTN